MRFVIIDVAADRGGALSVLKDFYEAVKAYDKDNEYIFLLSGPFLEETSNIKICLLPEIKKSRWKRLGFDLVKGKKYIEEWKPDVVFSLQNIIAFGIKVPQIVYIHQAIPYQKKKAFSFFKKKERQLAILQYGIGKMIHMSAKKASKVIVQTNWMKEAMIQKGIWGDKIAVIRPDVKMPNACKCQEIFSGNKFFYPTSEGIYKNNSLLPEACKLLEAEVAEGFQVEMTLLHLKPFNKHVRLLGRIPRAEVWKKYESMTLVFPSYIETYGMPLMEAKMAGTLILAADVEYAREVLAGYANAYFFDYRKAGELAGLMKKVIKGQIQKKDIGREEAQLDGWKQVIELMKSLSGI